MQIIRSSELAVFRQDTDDSGPGLLCEGAYQGILSRSVAAVLDQPAQQGSGAGIAGDSAHDVVGGVERHEIGRGDQVYPVYKMFSHGHCEPSAYHIAQDIVHHHVPGLLQNAEPVELVRHGGDAQAGAPRAGLGTSCLHTGDAERPGKDKLLPG